MIASHVEKPRRWHMDPVQRAFCRSLRQLMAKYPTAESAREARRLPDQSRPLCPTNRAVNRL